MFFDKYEFSDYVKFQGLYYPKAVVHTKYLLVGTEVNGMTRLNNKAKRIVNEVTTFRVISIDNKSLSSIGFDMERPPIGTHISDLRPEFINDNRTGLAYTYRNKKRTITETSAMWASKRKK